LLNLIRVTEGDKLAAHNMLLLLEEHPEWWGIHRERQSYTGSAHKDTETIYTRGPVAFTPEEYSGNASAVTFPVDAQLLWALHKLTEPALRIIRPEQVGYVMIVRLKAGGVITPHIDEGVYADHYSRFHIALSGGPNEALIVGDEEVHMEPGECWWFNHKVNHFADNPHDSDRIHVIFDVVLPD